MTMQPLIRTRTGEHRATSERWSFEAKRASSIREEKLGLTVWADELVADRQLLLVVAPENYPVHPTSLRPEDASRFVVSFVDGGELPLLHRREQTVEEEFRDLVDTWKKETEFVATLSEKVLHPAYQRIIALGHRVIPHILAELDRAPDHWFWALRFLVGVDVAEDEDTFNGAREVWLAWGRDRGLLPSSE